jgi:hypothetical protein
MAGSVDFDPTSTGTTALSGLAYVMKLTSGGNLAWARTFTAGGSPSTNSSVIPTDIAVDASGTVYTTGSYHRAVDFDPGTHKSQKFILDSPAGVAYVSALDSSGNFLWAKSMRFISGWNASAEALALDGVGGVYVAGQFRGTIDFDPGPGAYILTSVTADASDAFVWKLNTGGNFVWAGQMGGTGDDNAWAVDADALGNIQVAGRFQGTVDFNPGTGTYNLASNGGYDFFVAKLTETTAFSPTAGSATSGSANLLALTASSETADSTAITKRPREAARQLKRGEWIAPVDAALEDAIYSSFAVPES